VKCTTPGVLTMKTASYPESRDYLAISCNVTP